MADKEEKKKGGGIKAAVVSAIVVIIAAILALLKMIGIGPGSGGLLGNESGESGSETSVSVSESEAESGTEGETVSYIEIRVSGSTIMLNDSEVTAQEAAEKALAADYSNIVRITDDNATFNTMEELKKALDEKNISYVMAD